MQFVADLHLHSKYSRAVSKDMVLPIMSTYAKQKGLDILTVSDWTHPLWFKELQSQLIETGEGVYQLRNDTGEKPTYFILSTEISSIYTDKGKLRRIHNLVFAPNFEIAEKITKELLRRGANLMADGRPIIGLSSKSLLSLVLEIDERCLLIPCHVWTPHFGVYGSASGYDSLKESFEELTEYIYGIETGLSSDPEMNWQIAELKTRTILSFSDAHSPAKMGREATVFMTKDGISNIKYPISNIQFSYEDLRQAIMRKSDKWKIGYTIEFYPEEGKYHFSGHRNCKVYFGPEEIQEKGNICPVCHRRLTEGVLYRLQQLSDPSLHKVVSSKMNTTGLKWYTNIHKLHPPYVKLVPLNEIVAEALGSTVFSQKVKSTFAELCNTFGSELEVLLKTSIDAIETDFGQKIADGVRRVRAGEITIRPGFDGEYGKVEIWPEKDAFVLKDAGEKKKEPQLTIDF